MENSGQISAPGSLQAGTVIVPEAPRVPDQDLGELAREHELKLAGARPSLASYMAMLWQRRHFITGYATARNVSMYTDAKLGQIWQVLTPLLNAGVYYLIFGLLFEAARGVANYPAFLVAGVFVFAFSERSIVTGSNVMRANLQLIRALYFPRASLPLAYVIVELQQMLVGMVVLVVIMLVYGEYPSWYWLLLIPAVFLQSMFNTGAALIVARLGGSLADVSELIPFFLRISRYFCGVMYLIITLPAALSTGRSRSCRLTRSRSTSPWSASRSCRPTGRTRPATRRTTPPSATPSSTTRARSSPAPARPTTRGRPTATRSSPTTTSGSPPSPGPWSCSPSASSSSGARSTCMAAASPPATWPVTRITGGLELCLAASPGRSTPTRHEGKTGSAAKR